MPIFLPLLKQYWKQIALLSLMAGYTAYVYHAGILAERGKWEAKQARELVSYQNERDALQRKANEQAAQLEETLASQRNVNRQLRSKLNAELEKNRLYRDCVLPADGVRILNEAVSGRIATR